MAVFHGMLSTAALVMLSASNAWGQKPTPAPSAAQAAASEQLGLTGGAFVDIDGVPNTPDHGFSITLPVGEAEFTLSLEPSSVRAGNFRIIEEYAPGQYRNVPAPPARTFRGVLDEMPGSRVAASLLDDGLFATIQIPGADALTLEPLAPFGGTARAYVMYSRHDVLESGASCIAKLGSKTAARSARSITGQDKRSALGTSANPCPEAGLYVAEVATDADYEYFLDYGSVPAVNEQIESILNAVNLQFERDVSITHIITAMVVRTTDNDPYTFNDAEALLTQMTNHWNQTQQNVDRDTVHLFTGRDLDGVTIGIAWMGPTSICGNLAYGIVQSDWQGLGASFACKTDLSAHELGHNWGANHCNCPAWTMNPNIQCNNQFNPTLSIPEILDYRSNRANRDACLDFVGEIPQLLRLTIDPLAPSVLEGQTLAFDVIVDLPKPPCADDFDASAEVLWLVTPAEAGVFDDQGQFTAGMVDSDTEVMVTAFYDGKYGADDDSSTFVVIDESNVDRQVVIHLDPSVPANQMQPGQSFTADLMLSSAGGDIADLRLLQFDSRLSSGVTLDAFNWTFDGLVSDSLYATFENEEVFTAVYIPQTPSDGFIVQLDGTPQRVAQLELTFQANGSLNLLGDPNPPSQDFSVLFLSGFVDQDEYAQANANIMGGDLPLTQSDIVLTVVSSAPPDGAIDARQPTDINGADPAGWSSIDIQFNGDVADVAVADFQVTQSGGIGPPPTVNGVHPLNATSVIVELTGPIEAGAWTDIQHLPGGQTIRLGYLPADVNGDATSGPLDILDLIDALNGVTELNEWSTDVDRSDETTPSDLLRVIDLLNGAGAFDAWNGASLP